MDRSVEEGSRHLINPDTADFSREANECYYFALSLARRRIPEEIKESHIINSKEVITDEDVTFIHKLSRRACVYGCLAAFRELRKRAQWSDHRAHVLECRAMACEVLAVRLVKMIAGEGGPGKEELFVEVLTPLFKSVRHKHETESALEVAVEANATKFINELAVQQCVEYIWRGRIVPQPTHVREEDHRDGDGYVQIYTWPHTIKTGFAALPEGRLRVPMYQYAAETFFYFVLLGVFTFVVNYRTPVPNPVEIIMYLLVLCYAIMEGKQYWSAGSNFYFLSLFNWNDLISVILLVLAFCFRMYGYHSGSREVLEGPNDTAYDLLACCAVFLWTRALHVLAGLKYFGEMVVIIRALLRDSVLFFVMFLFVLIGFVQAFAGLARADPSESPGFLKGSYLLAKAFLQAPDFEEAEKMHDVLGPPLLIFWQILATVIMLNMLIAFFNQSYSKIVDSTEEQHVVQFTIKVLGYYLLPTQYPFIPPTNLLEITLLPIPRILLPRPQYLKLLRHVWMIVMLPWNLAIAVFEASGVAASWNWVVKEDEELDDIGDEAFERDVLEHLDAEERDFLERLDAGAKKSDRTKEPASTKQVEKSTDAGSGSDASGSMEEMLRMLMAEVKELRAKVEEIAEGQ